MITILNLVLVWWHSVREKMEARWAFLHKHRVSFERSFSKGLAKSHVYGIITVAIVIIAIATATLATYLKGYDHVYRITTVVIVIITIMVATCIWTIKIPNTFINSRYNMGKYVNQWKNFILFTFTVLTRSQCHKQANNNPNVPLSTLVKE